MQLSASAASLGASDYSTVTQLERGPEAGFGPVRSSDTVRPTKSPVIQAMARSLTWTQPAVAQYHPESARTRIRPGTLRARAWPGITVVH